MKIKKGAFIELDYIGRIKEDGRIFDLTSVEIAKKEGLYHEQQQYGPRVICVGEGQIGKAIDSYLEGKDTGTYTLSLEPEQAFGKKNAKLMKIVPISLFHKQKIRPFPGLQINMDGFMGIVKTVSGGRVIVDFNHPLAGRNVMYELTVKRVVTDVKEKIKAHLHTLFGKDIDFTFAQGKLTVDFPLPEPVQQQVNDHIKKVIPDVKDIRFSTPKEEKKQETKQQKKATTQP